MTDEPGMDPGLLSQLEQEFMDLAKKGDYGAFCFALNTSDGFCHASTAVLQLITQQAETPQERFDLGSTIEEAAIAVAGRKRLIKAFEEVASKWARAEYDKRIAENEEMVGSWQETA